MGSRVRLLGDLYHHYVAVEFVQNMLRRISEGNATYSLTRYATQHNEFRHDLPGYLGDHPVHRSLYQMNVIVGDLVGVSQFTDISLHHL